jgi:hypothetical protein
MWMGSVAQLLLSVLMSLFSGVLLLYWCRCLFLLFGTNPQRFEDIFAQDLILAHHLWRRLRSQA